MQECFRASGLDFQELKLGANVTRNCCYLLLSVGKKKTLTKSKQSDSFKADEGLPGMSVFVCCGCKENVCILRALQNEFLYLLLGRPLYVKVSQGKILFL